MPPLQHVKAMLKGNADDREVYIALAQMYSRVKAVGRGRREHQQGDGALAPSRKTRITRSLLPAPSTSARRNMTWRKRHFRKVLADDPKNAMALNYLGYMLADRGTRLDEALGYIRRAVALDPQNGAYLDSLGWAYYKMGNYELAEENLRRASETIGDDPTVHEHLGELYQKTGRLKLAAAHWERALEEWNKTIPAEVDTDDVAKVQKELESAKVKLAKQNGGCRYYQAIELWRFGKRRCFGGAFSLLIIRSGAPSAPSPRRRCFIVVSTARDLLFSSFTSHHLLPHWLLPLPRC